MLSEKGVVMVDASESATLRLTIDTDRPVRARDTAKIVGALNHAFEFSARGRDAFSNEHLELRLVHLRSGSLIADMIGFAGAFVTMSDFYKAAVTRIRELVRAMAAMRGTSKRDLHISEVAALKALSAPVAYDSARQVTVQVVGDNANVLVIDAEAAKVIRKFLAKSQKLLLADPKARMIEPRAAFRMPEKEAKRILANLNRRAKRGERGSTEKIKGGWRVHWRISPEETWSMRLIADKQVLGELSDATEYTFIGQAIDDPKRGLTFLASSAEYWDEVELG